MSGSDPFFRVASRAVRALVLELPDSEPAWKAASRLVRCAPPGSDLARALTALSIEPADFATWAASERDQMAEPIERRDLVTSITRGNRTGFTSGDLLRLVFDEGGVFGAVGYGARIAWRLADRDIDDVLTAVRRVSAGAVRSAAVTGGGPEDSAHTVLERCEAGGPERLAIASSVGLARLLRRADELCAREQLPAITTSCIFRASLPLMATPELRAFIRGAGIGPEIHTWLKTREAGSYRMGLSRSATTYYLSRDAWFALYRAGHLMAAGSPITAEQIVLGLLMTPESCLASACAARLGGGVNLPLLFLHMAVPASLSPDRAATAIAAGDSAAGEILPLDDIPPRQLVALERQIDRLDALSEPSTDRSQPSLPARATQAIAAWRASAGERNGYSHKPDGEEAQRTFDRTGHFDSLREAMLNVPDPDYDPMHLGVQMLRSATVPFAQAKRVTPRADRENPTVLEALVASLAGDATAQSRARAAKTMLIVAQDWSHTDLLLAREIGPSLTELAFAAARHGEYSRAGACLALERRLEARIFRAREGLRPGLAGSNPSFAQVDLARADGQVVFVALEQNCALALLFGDGEPRASIRPVPQGAIRRWWAQYRLACHAGHPTRAALVELAELAGIAEVEPGRSNASPIRVCAAGSYAALPFGQAVLALLTDRRVPVITHVAGGPFADRFGDAEAPRSRLARRVAVMPPPIVAGAEDLPFAKAEADAVASLHQARFPIAVQDCGRASLLRLLELADPGHRPVVWHFAAHGSIRPAPSGHLTAGVVVMDNELLAAVDIGRYVQGGAFICSNCDIAAVPPTPAAESWPFAALAGGAAYVVAAPRPVSDPVTLACMVKMHELWRESQTPIWRALTDAQCWLEAAGSEEVEALLLAHSVDAGIARRSADAVVLDRSSSDLGAQWSFGAFAV